ncbi:MAG TPA: peptidylprolyl isomerase, partial [Oligella sp.]|nr:peptidylprolyl isomerase [Oligella sp.]
VLKYIVVLSVILLTSNAAFVVADEKAWVVENEAVQINEAELRLITKALMINGQIPQGKLSAAYVEKAAKDFILYKALAVDAQKLGLDQSPEVQKLLELSKHRMLGGIYLADYSDKLDLPDFESIALENYALNKEQFVRPETVNAQHILIAFEGDEEKSKLLAKEVRAKVVEGKQSFAELAKKHSTDSSVEKNSGNLGFFDKSQMVAEFSEVAFSLKEGEVSQPVKSQFGWHIIQVLEKRPAKTLEFSEVKDNLIRTAEQSFKQNARGKKLNETVYTPGLKVNEELINKIANDLLNE